MVDEIEWRDVPGFEGAYQVSRCGRVRSLDRVIWRQNRWGKLCAYRQSGKELAITAFPNGYLKVSLGAGDCSMVHRLVAMAFVSGDHVLQVNHKNGTRDDNRAENLEWVTCRENHLHSYRELPRKKHAKTSPVVVGGVWYESQLAAAKALGINAGSVHSALHRNHRCLGMEVQDA